MLTDIEQFLFGGNIAHDILGISKNGTTWVIEIESHAEGNERKLFSFSGVVLEYEQNLCTEGKEFEFPLPIIGLESRPVGQENWRFLLNASDIEWAFISKWPKNITRASSKGGRSRLRRYPLSRR